MTQTASMLRIGVRVCLLARRGGCRLVPPVGGNAHRSHSSASTAWPGPTAWHLSRGLASQAALGHVNEINDPLEVEAEPSKPVNRFNLPEHLRPYQVEAIEKCMDALERGIRRMGVSSPTGSGKTVMFTQLIPLLIGRKGNVDGQILILVGNIDLARQAIATVSRDLPHLTVELEQGVHRASGTADVTVATYQSLISGERLQKFDPGNFRGVIVDEAHHAAAPSYIKLLRYFNSDVKSNHSAAAEPADNEIEVQSIQVESALATKDGPHTPLIGFTATFSRADQEALSQVFEEIVFHQEMSEMLIGGYLAPTTLTTVQVDEKSDLDTVKVDKATGDYSPTSLAEKLNKPIQRAAVVRAWSERAADRKATLLFGINVAHTRALTNDFRAHGVDARYVTAATSDRERKTLIEGFKAGEFPILANCQVFLEGTDMPNVDCIVCARPTKSKNLYLQMIGRGLRNHPGKVDCLVIDLKDNYRLLDVAAEPTLDGLERSAEQVKQISSAPILRVRSELEEEEEPIEMQSEDEYSLSYRDIADPFGVASKDARDLYKVFRNGYAWVACGSDKYVLEGLEHYFSINREAPTPANGNKTIFLLWHGLVLRKEKRTGTGASRSPYSRLTVHGKTTKLKHAIEMGNALVERYIGMESRHMRVTNRLFRFLAVKRRASPAQIAALEKRGYGAVLDERNPRGKFLAVGDSSEDGSTAGDTDGTSERKQSDVFAGMTKGEAASILTAIIHGVKSHLKITNNKKARELKKAKKVRKLIQRSTVKVGKLS